MTAIDFAAFFDELALVSGETIRPFFRSALSVENKSGSGGFDPVTAADRAAEAGLRALINKTFPAPRIRCGGFSADPPEAPRAGPTRAAEPVYGMMHQPFIREQFSGDGSGSRYRGPAGERVLQT